MAFQKILCPVDFSKTSRHALDRAAELAGPSGAQLTLLHVIGGAAGAGVALRPGAAAGLAPRLLTPPMESPEQAERNLSDWRAALAQAGVSRSEQAIAYGEPAPEILRLAQEGGFDLIVLGTHGKTGVLGALLGNVSYKVVRTASCSVLTVREPEAA